MTSKSVDRVALRGMSDFGSTERLHRQRGVHGETRLHPHRSNLTDLLFGYLRERARARLVDVRPTSCRRWRKARSSPRASWAWPKSVERRVRFHLPVPTPSPSPPPRNT